MKKFRLLSLCIIFLSIVFSTICMGKQADAAYNLNKKAYSLVEGKWYTYNSSGGYNVKFTRTKIKYYDRKTGKLDHTGEIKGCKKYKNGYLIQFKMYNKKLSYYIKKKNPDELWFYGSWKRDGTKYSSSSSLHIGKWDE